MHNFDNIFIINNELFKNSQVFFLSYQAKVSELFLIEARMTCDFNVLQQNKDDILHKNISFKVEYGNDKKFYSGLISEIKQEIIVNEFNTTKVLVHMIVLPCLYTLKFQNGYRSFSEKKSIDVINFFIKRFNNKFKGFQALTSNIYNKDALVKKMNIVQYGESDFDFLIRIIQQEQISFYFTHSEEGHEIIFTDDLNKSFSENKNLNNSQLKLKILARKDDISSADFSKHGYLSDQACNYKKIDKFINKNIRFFDYDFRNFPLVSETTPHDENSLSWHSNTNIFKKSVKPLDPSAEEISQQNKKINYISETESNSILFETHNHSIMIGSHITLDLGPMLTFKEQEKTRVYEIDETYEIKQNQHLGLSKVKTFLDIGKYTFSVQKLTGIKNQVYPPCTAIIFGKTAGDIAEIDELMLIKISFFWHNSPSSASKDAETSDFVKARLGQMSAGAGRGSVIIPRVGDEVIVCFENGDPELPIIIGSLYNKKNYTPNKIADEAEINIFRTSPSENNSTKKFNEMIFDERKNKEIISFNARKDLGFITEEKTSFKSKNFETEVLESSKHTTKNYEFKITENGKLTVKNGDFTINVENSNMVITAKENLTIKASKVEIKGKKGSMVIE